jgi:hypothetical protein
MWFCLDLGSIVNVIMMLIRKKPYFCSNVNLKNVHVLVDIYHVIHNFGLNFNWTSSCLCCAKVSISRIFKSFSLTFL